MLIVFIVKHLTFLHTQQIRFFERLLLFAGISAVCLLLASCVVFSTTYDIGKGTVKAATDLTVGTCKVAYNIGKYTFLVVMAPLDWAMTQDIESIDGMSPKEAIEKGRVKNSPYVVKGKRYVPMSIEEAYRYSEVGVASWYGKETRKQKGGKMTANGEAFDPKKPTAAHKYLPLPTHVRVTNISNGKSIIVRVNDRGPFVDGRIIDLSSGAAKQLGFYRKGLTKVKIETVPLK